MGVCNRDCGLQSIRNQREGKLGTLAGMAMVQRCHLYLENRLCQVCGHLRLPPRLRLEV